MDHLKNCHSRLTWGDDCAGDLISVYDSLLLFKVYGDYSSGGNSGRNDSSGDPHLLIKEIVYY